MLRRGLQILALVFAMLAAQTLWILGHGSASPVTASGVMWVQLMSLAAAAGAGAIGLRGMSAMRRQCAALAAQVGEMNVSSKPAALGCDEPDLAALVNAIDAFVGQARSTASAAAIKAKEMEIRMKVAVAERQHAESIIHGINDAVLVTDSFDEVVLANESAANAFEFDLAKSARAPVSSVLHGPKLLGLIREMRQHESLSDRRVLEHTLAAPGGGRTFKVTLSCFADRAHVAAGSMEGAGARARPSGVVAVLHDMTKEKELAAMKNDFVSNVSHELRTPLASIKAYVEMLIDGEAEEEKTKVEFYEVIQNEANRLGRLIDDILNISRIESGLVKVNKEPQSLAVILREAVEVMTPQARQKGITVREGLTPIYYQTVADRDMLYQAVLNLLSNAVKYTPEGGTIEVLTTVDESKRAVVTRINDTGVGIPTRDLPYVFDKFYRAEANNRMAKGTGLGLSLVKQIIETVHGGKMFVESTVGKGSSFGFELRLAD